MMHMIYSLFERVLVDGLLVVHDPLWDEVKHSHVPWISRIEEVQQRLDVAQAAGAVVVRAGADGQ